MSNVEPLGKSIGYTYRGFKMWLEKDMPYIPKKLLNRMENAKDLDELDRLCDKL